VNSKLQFFVEKFRNTFMQSRCRFISKYF